MKALLRYSIAEALSSLARGWRTNLLSIGVIAAAVFVAAAVLLVSVNVQRILDRLATTAELRIYLRHGATDAGSRAGRAPDCRQPRRGLRPAFVDAATALQRFRRDVPELAALAGALDENPLPPAFEVRLREGHADEQARALADALTKTGARRGRALRPPGARSADRRSAARRAARAWSLRWC